MLGLLAHVVIADDLAAARAVWRKLGPSEASALTVITKAGDVLSRFVLRGGSGAKRSRLELVADRDAADTALAAVTELIEDSRSALAQQRAELQAAKERAAAALSALREFDAQRAAHTEKLGVARVQAESAAAEVQRLERATATITQSVRDATGDSERAAAELDTARSRPRPILDVSSRDGVAADLDAAREAEVQARLRVETAKERVRVEKLRAESLERQRERDRVAAEEAARRAVIRRAQAQAAQSVIDALPPVLDAVNRSLSEARAATGRPRGRAVRAEHGTVRTAPPRSRCCANGCPPSATTCTDSRCRSTRRNFNCRRCSSGPGRTSAWSRTCWSRNTVPRCSCRRMRPLPRRTMAVRSPTPPSASGSTGRSSRRASRARNASWPSWAGSTRSPSRSSPPSNSGTNSSPSSSPT